MKNNQFEITIMKLVYDKLSKELIVSLRLKNLDTQERGYWFIRVDKFISA